MDFLRIIGEREAGFVFSFFSSFVYKKPRRWTFSFALDKSGKG